MSHDHQAGIDFSSEHKRAIGELKEEYAYSELIHILIRADHLPYRSFSLLVKMAFFIFEGLSMEHIGRRTRLVSWFKESAGDKWQSLKEDAKALIEEFDAETRRMQAAVAAEEAASAEERTATVIGHKIVLGDGFRASFKAARKHGNVVEAFETFLSENFLGANHKTRTWMCYVLANEVFTLPQVTWEDRKHLAEVLQLNVEKTLKREGEDFTVPKLVREEIENIEEERRRAAARDRVVRHAERVAKAALRPQTSSKPASGDGHDGSAVVAVGTSTTGTHATLAEQMARLLNKGGIVTDDTIVASRRSDLYHRAGSVVINQKNLVIFGSEEEAQKKGYRPSAHFK